jgi:hypothetical protein
MKTSVRFLFHGAVLAAALGLAGPASATLVHRYSFTTDARDSVGTANGAAAQLRDANGPVGSPVTFQSGQAVLDGTGGYIDLPNGIVSGLTNLTLETWVTWTGAGNWQRIFDFGTGDVGEDTDGSKRPASALNYLFLTPQSSATGRTRLAITDQSNGAGQERPVLDDTDIFPYNEVHVAVVYGPSGAHLYINGVEKAKGAVSIPLSAVKDVNNWLGRSNWPDPLFAGTFNEFRIHDSLLTSQAVAASAAGGPDKIGYDPGTVTSLSFSVANSMLSGEFQDPQIRASFSGAGDLALNGTDIALTSSNTNAVEVATLGKLHAVGPGTAVITASIGGKTNTATVNVTASVPVLINRYSFNEPAGSTAVKDSVGGADGSVFPGTNATTVVGLGNGQASFPTVANYQGAAYIALPGGLVSSRTNITIETWYTWKGPNSQGWQRVFDFGNSQKSNGDAHNAGNGLAYLFLTPRNGASGVVRFVAKPDSAAENPILNGTAYSPLNVEQHVVCVYAPRSQYSRLYVNGVPVSSGTAPFELNTLSDPYCWLGVSLYNDPPFYGSINEMRIYEGALTDLDVALHSQSGPDAIPAAPGSLKTLSLTAPALYPGNTVLAPSSLLANFQNISNVNIAAVAGVTFTSKDTNIFTVNSLGQLLPVKSGSAQLLATYQTLSATTTVTVLTPTVLRLVMTNSMYAGGVSVTPSLLADFPGVSNVNVIGFTGVGNSLTSSAPAIASINTNGIVNPLKSGSTVISANYQGLSAQSTLAVAPPPNYKRAQLLHRYSFDGAPGSTVVKDSVGTADGTVMNPTGTDFDGKGRLTLTGGAAQLASASFVDLPNGLVSRSTNSGCTLEGWVNWYGASTLNWARIFDIGRNSATDGSGNFLENQFAGTGIGYMFLTPRSGGTGNRFRFAIKQGTGDETPVIDAPFTAAVSNEFHFAVVYDWPAGNVRLYYNGARCGSGIATLPLSVVEDLNVWLGRSQWNDPFFAGAYNEFRIYDGVLEEEEVLASFTAGPDQLVAPAPAQPTLSVKKSTGGNIVVSWPASANGFTLLTSGALGSTWTASNLTPTSDGATFTVTIPVGNTNAFYRLRQ